MFYRMSAYIMRISIDLTLVTSEPFVKIICKQMMYKCTVSRTFLRLLVTEMRHVESFDFQF